jgi:predicted outer membrane repeat protein
VKDCIFQLNGASFGAAITNFRDNIVVENCVLTGNIAIQDGGAVEGFENSYTNITNSSFRGNTAHDGAAVFSRGNGTLSDCSFTKQEAKSVGGCIKIARTGTVEVNRCEFVSNTATSGAAIYTSGALSINSSSFADHTASVSGTVYGSKGSYVSINNSMFTKGQSAFGAAAYFESSTVFIDSSIFADNSVRSAGGSLYCEACTLDVTTSSFHKNKCTTGDGGAIYIDVNSKENIDTCIVTMNDAVAHGGAICSSLSTTTTQLLISNTEFIYNTAGRSGAAVFYNGIESENSTVNSGNGSSSSTTTMITDEMINATTNNVSYNGNTASCCYAQGYSSSTLLKPITDDTTANTPTITPSYTCQDIDSGGLRGSECCTNGQYTNGTKCIACNTQEFTCDAGTAKQQLGIITATLPLRSGYWRVDTQTDVILECWHKQACKGGTANAITNDVNDYCSTGYTGPCKW